jgi:hypothetical protein
MTVTMKIDGAAGKAAIYTGDDDLPLANPMAHLPRVKFHSDFSYPGIIAEYTGSLTMGTTSPNARRLVTNRVRAHGRPGIPWVLGSFIVGGVAVAACGTVPVQQHQRGYGFARWLALGADGTDIIIYENALGYYLNDYPPSDQCPAMTIQWRALVTDVLL